MPLAAGITVKELISSGDLETPEEWLRVVLIHMMQCRSEYGNCRMQIGITGTGKRPFHKISYTDDAGESRIFGAFDGKSPFRCVAIHEGNTWGDVLYSIEQVQDHLGELRGFKPKKKP